MVNYKRNSGPYLSGQQPYTFWQHDLPSCVFGSRRALATPGVSSVTPPVDIVIRPRNRYPQSELST
ncbi:predicted protein [Sclerotinia sclerotiorum 1980 UF-70]|uniref:Uncharacterized protein n=1 Tax=Sclerotinia sclerotiorum (strain ATCC 18683 / 1980 / Ss-1) TaxID=665079 RepID=A7F7Q4_SCLS1|nr:predicted protein [Sclerotinia sclerotiorum 1980 UF-70]EDN98775.1 predicted protein [Sclerotinia sclerotiorum 1980 UF-70]